MCGIAVLYGQRYHPPSALVERMLDRVRYRGYKHFEIGAKGRCVLGANRLDIVDRERGRQPLWNEDGSVCAVLNGEIYNHPSLIGRLQELGHRFRTSCDTEVLVHAYEEWGPGCVHYLDGMFAFGVYDDRSEKLLVGRDPFGVKPLYMARGEDFLAFASEIKCFHAIPIKDISVLPPGHIFWDNRTSRYFNYPEQAPEVSFDQARDQVRRLVRDSVAKRVDTDLPIAVFVSGGVDSAIVLQLTSQLHPDVTAISVGMKGSPDLASARLLCARLGVRHIWREVDGLELGGWYEKLIHHLESFEPNLVRASIFTFLMSRLARENGFRVVLAGEGSDEQFAGYADFAVKADPKALQSELHCFFRDLHRTQLLRWDKIAMANTLEVRFPYMDKALVRFAWNLPAEFKLDRSRKGVVTKHILRAAFQDLLPPHFADREKVPMDEGAFANGRDGLEQMIQLHIDRNKCSGIAPGICRRYQLRSPEEKYNYSVFHEEYNQVAFAQDRVKVRKNGGK